MKATSPGERKSNNGRSVERRPAFDVEAIIGDASVFVGYTAASRRIREMT